MKERRSERVVHFVRYFSSRFNLFSVCTVKSRTILISGGIKVGIFLLSVALLLVFVALIAKPVGIYIANVFSNDKNTSLIGKIETVMFKAAGIKGLNQTWKQYAFALVLTNTFMIFVVYLIFRFQGYCRLTQATSKEWIRLLLLTRPLVL